MTFISSLRFLYVLTDLASLDGVVASLQLCRVLVSVATSWVMMVHSCAVLLILRAKKKNHPGLWLLKTAVSFRLCQNEVGR